MQYFYAVTMDAWEKSTDLQKPRFQRKRSGYGFSLQLILSVTLVFIFTGPFLYNLQSLIHAIYLPCICLEIT